MRWACDRHGCFNVHKRPKIEVFAEFLPAGTSFGDVDGIHEYRGLFILLEWKPSSDWASQPDRVSAGQSRLFREFTKALYERSVVFVIAGDAKTMQVHWLKRFWRGGETGWDRSSLDDVGRRIRTFWTLSEAGIEGGRV